MTPLQALNKNLNKSLPEVENVYIRRGLLFFLAPFVLIAGPFVILIYNIDEYLSSWWNIYVKSCWYGEKTINKKKYEARDEAKSD